MRYASKTRALFAVLVAGFVVASCGGDKIVSAPRSNVPATSSLLEGALGGTVDNTTQSLLGSLMTCRPLPYASDSKVIGPAGGLLNIGPHTLRIPAGALSEPVRISGEAPSDPTNSLRFAPEGLHFDRPAALTMSYSNCSVVVGLLPRIAYTNEQLQILEFIPSLPDLFARKVTGKLEHFSRYAVSW